MEEIQLIASISLKTKQEEEEFLPQDILLEIFTKLPTKSVGKCRCLSKLWSIQLSTPHFIKKHLKIRQNRCIQLKQENLVLVDGEKVEGSEKPFGILTCPTNKQEESRKYISPDLDLDLVSYYVFVIGSSHGLVLMEKNNKRLLMLGKYFKQLLLINPITLKQVKVPDVPITKRTNTGLQIFYGFGYDCVSHEYKVVVIARYHLKTTLENVVRVYSVKKGGSWRVVKDSGCWGDLYNPDSHGVLLNGALHWEAGSRRPNTGRKIIVFDLASESFHRIQSPSKLNRDDPMYSKVMALGGCLCTVDSCGGIVDLWIMKEYGVVESWTNVRIHGDGMWDAIRLLCAAGDDKVLGLSNKDKWYLCDLREGTCKEVAVGVEVNSLYTSVCSFVDSLVDPEQLVNIPEEVAG